MEVQTSIDKILSDLYHSEDLNRCLVKFVSPRHIDDFKQDLFIKLLKYQESVLLAHGRGELKYYAARCIINLATEKRGLYKTNYLSKEGAELKEHHLKVCEESFPFEVRKMKEDREDKIIEKIKNSEKDLGTPYYRLLAEALEIHGTAGKVSKATGIPKSSVQVGIKKLRQYVKHE